MPVLYERVIVALLVESKVDTFARKLVQKVVRAVKKTMDKVNKQGGIRLKVAGEWPRFMKRQDYFATPAGRFEKQARLGISAIGPMTVTIQLLIVLGKGVSSTDSIEMSGSWSPPLDTLSIEVYVNSTTGVLKRDHLSLIQRKAYEIVRHELEHTGQSQELLEPASRANKELQSIPDSVWKSPQALQNYFLSEAETQAFVAGIYHRAKRMRVPFVQAVDDTLEDFMRSGVKHGVDAVKMRNVLSSVKYKWIEYAKKRFPKAVTS